MKLAIKSVDTNKINVAKKGFFEGFGLKKSKGDSVENKVKSHEIEDEKIHEELVYENGELVALDASQNPLLLEYKTDDKVETENRKNIKQTNIFLGSEFSIFQLSLIFFPLLFFTVSVIIFLTQKFGIGDKITITAFVISGICVISFVSLFIRIFRKNSATT